MKMRILFFATLISALMFCMSTDTWRQVGSKYTVSTGGQVEVSLAASDEYFVNDETGEYFRCRMFWCYNGTTEKVYLSRWKFFRSVDLSTDPNVSSRIYLDTYHSLNPYGGIAVEPGQTYVSEMAFDGFYWVKESGIADQLFTWEAMR